MSLIRILLTITFLFISPTLYGMKKDSIMLPMNDGVRLNTNIYLPDNAEGPLPVILIRTTYDADDPLQGNAYIAMITDMMNMVLVAQDSRGSYDSEGEDSLFLEDGWGYTRDGYETIEWIAAQDWCDGNVGMFGSSALAIPQYLASGANPPHLKCGVPVVGSWNLFKECIYQGGQYRQEDVNRWILGNSSADMLAFARENYLATEIWDRLDCSLRLDSMNTPFLHIGGWYDFFSPGQLEAFRNLQYYGGEGALGNQKVIIGPWTHTKIGQNKVGEINFPSNANYDLIVPAIEWMAHWLRGDDTDVMNSKNIKLYLMGPIDEEGYWNDWLEFDDWDEFRNTDTLRLYLSPGDFMSATIPAKDEASFDYDPKNPVPTNGGTNLLFKAGPYDQSSGWSRDDVLTFVAPSYEKPYDIFGRINLRLLFSSDREDTDLTGKLVDIYPDGRKELISDGIAVARRRMSMYYEDFLTPGEEYILDIDLNYTAYTIVPGHRLGLAVSSSNYPKYAVNPNTKAPFFKSEDTLIAHNTIYFGEEYGSVLTIPYRKNGMNAVSTSHRPKFISNVITVSGSKLAFPIEKEYKNSEIIIYDLNGQILERLDIPDCNATTLVPFNYNAGVYFAVIQSAGDIKIFKILKPGK